MSSKAPVRSDKKSEAEPQSISSIVIYLCLAVILLVSGFIAFSFLNDRTVIINERRLNVLVADSSAERQQGLSGRNRLKDNEGMLFEFDSDGVYCFWMKDMKFAIDMIWLDKNKKVVHVQENATPDSYPESFCPNSEARYVLEISAGNANKIDIKLGDQVTF